MGDVARGRESRRRDQPLRDPYKPSRSLLRASDAAAGAADVRGTCAWLNHHTPGPPGVRGWPARRGPKSLHDPGHAVPAAGNLPPGALRGESWWRTPMAYSSPRSADGASAMRTPSEAEALIEAVPGPDRPIWATAMYAGLRRGQLQALRAQRPRPSGRRNPGRVRLGVP